LCVDNFYVLSEYAVITGQGHTGSVNQHSIVSHHCTQHLQVPYTVVLKVANAMAFCWVLLLTG